jgi:hypothetical protein
MKILSPLNFKYLWLFLPSLLIALYGIQALVGLNIYHDEIASEFFRILALGLFSYLLTYFLLNKHFGCKKFLVHPPFFLKQSTDWWIKGTLLVYILLIIYALLTAPKIALWESINGASAENIALAREVFLKDRAGSEIFLVYLNAIFSNALMPYVLALIYLKKTPYRHILLTIFLISLLPSLEKGLAIKACLPLAIIAFNGYLSRRTGYLIIFLMIIFIYGVTNLSKMGAQQNIQDYPDGIRSNLSQEIPQEKHCADKVKKYTLQDYQTCKYDPLGSGNQLIYLANRVLWIPYITAYDWLGYFHKIKSGRHLNGQTSQLISILTGKPKIEMEKEVFIYQYGAGGPKTASANAVFLVDAFVNFGWLGVLLSAILVAILTFFVVCFDNPAMKACFFYFAYQLSIGSILGVMFSGGMLILLVLSIFIRPSVSKL